ncbi:MAG: hypothetical protein ACPF8V_07125 [Luteibaculum sp.]
MRFPLLLVLFLFSIAVLKAQQYEDGQGVWLKGDFHVHSTGASNDTGGDSYVKSIKEKGQERGLYFVVLTDHSNSTGSDVSTTEEDPTLFNMGNEFPQWDSARILTETGKFIMVCGNEISPIVEGEVPLTATGHIGCVPRSLNPEEFDTTGVFIDRPRGSVSGADVLEQSNNRGAFSIINHPYSPTPWISYDWTNLTDYHGMEVWNGTGGWDPFDEMGYNLWRTDLLQGKRITPVGGSDNHRVNKEVALFPPDLLNPALGFPTTSVFAKDSTWEGIVEGLNLGWVCIHEGESFLSITPLNDAGEYTEKTDFTAFRLRGKLDERAPIPFTLQLRNAISAIDQRPYYGTTEVLEIIPYSSIIQPGESFDVEVPVLSNLGLFTATLLPSAPLSAGNETHYVALSRAVLGSSLTNRVENQVPEEFFKLASGQDAIHVKFRAAVSEEVEIHLFSQNGMELKKETMKANGKLQSISYSNLKPGLYIIRLNYSGSKKSFARRIMLF